MSQWCSPGRSAWLDGWDWGIGDSRARRLHRGRTYHGGTGGSGWRRRSSGRTYGRAIGMGIPEYEAKRYEGKVKDGNILLSIHTEDSTERDQAKKILETGGAEEISYTSEASVPKDQIAADFR
jgi:hypothetical protein